MCIRNSLSTKKWFLANDTDEHLCKEVPRIVPGYLPKIATSLKTVLSTCRISTRDSYFAIQKPWKRSDGDGKLYSFLDILLGMNSFPPKSLTLSLMYQNLSYFREYQRQRIEQSTFCNKRRKCHTHPARQKKEMKNQAKLAKWNGRFSSCSFVLADYVLGNFLVSVGQ